MIKEFRGTGVGFRTDSYEFVRGAAWLSSTISDLANLIIARQ